MRARLLQALVLSAACGGTSSDDTAATASTSITSATSPGSSTTGEPDPTTGSVTSTVTNMTSTSNTTTADPATTADSTTTTAATTGEPDPTAGTTTADTTTGVPDSCAYELVHEQLGELLTVTYDNSLFSIKPLPDGKSFYCMRIEFDMQTFDSFEQILMDFEGCPIYTGISGLRGTPKQTGKALANVLFKDYKVGCEPGPDRLEIDTFVDSGLKEGPWPMGGLYHFEITVEPFVSRVRILQNGEQLGETVEASIAGATLDNARDPVIELGMSGPADGAYFPDYGGVYSNLQVWAEVAD